MTGVRTIKTEFDVRLMESICSGLRQLPLTSEQWETNHEPIVKENLWRLTAMIKGASAHIKEPSRVLDVGIGFGYTSAAIRAAFPDAEIIGVEHPSRSLIYADDWRRICNMVPVSPIGVDAYSLPFRDRSFDLVICGEIIEHLAPTRIPAFLLEINRVSTDKAVLVLTTPNLLSLTNRGMMALGRSPFELPIPSAGETYGHIREYSSGDLASLLAIAGFSDVNVVTVPRHRHDASNSLFVRAVSLLERLAGSAAPSLNGFLVASAVRNRESAAGQ